MSKTVVGLFNTTTQAEQVKQTLVNEGFDSSDIKIVANDHNDGHAEGEGIGHKISHFFSSLTGGDDKSNEYYAQGVDKGRALLSVDTDEADAEEVAALLQQHGARIEEGAYGGSDPYAQQTRTSAAGEVIPIVEEQLVVGKREVDRGGVRVFSRLVQEPVSADVTLRDEAIAVERRIVDRPATEADFQTGTAAFELHASGEEVVVGKTSRVVEEVLVGKEASQHTEAIHDTLRRTEIEVEDLVGTSTTSDRPAASTIDKDRL